MVLLSAWSKTVQNEAHPPCMACYRQGCAFWFARTWQTCVILQIPARAKTPGSYKSIHKAPPRSPRASWPPPFVSVRGLGWVLVGLLSLFGDERNSRGYETS